MPFTIKDRIARVVALMVLPLQAACLQQSPGCFAELSSGSSTRGSSRTLCCGARFGMYLPRPSHWRPRPVLGFTFKLGRCGCASGFRDSSTPSKCMQLDSMYPAACGAIECVVDDIVYVEYMHAHSRESCS